MPLLAPALRRPARRLAVVLATLAALVLLPTGARANQIALDQGVTLTITPAA